MQMKMVFSLYGHTANPSLFAPIPILDTSRHVTSSNHGNQFVALGRHQGSRPLITRLEDITRSLDRMVGGSLLLREDTKLTLSYLVVGSSDVSFWRV